jgi:hypothetical protein
MTNKPDKPTDSSPAYIAPYPDGGATYKFRRWQGGGSADERAIARGCDLGHRDRDEGRQ